MDKETLKTKRTQFFENILDHMNRPPARIDKILQQDVFYIEPDKENTFYDAEAGDLAICITGKFFDKTFTLYYSFWQLGDMLRIGIALDDDELFAAFPSDNHNEVTYLWGLKNEPRVDISHGCVFYDWEFSVENLYDSYKNQEKFILGARHMHFRTMRIIHDQCERIFIDLHQERLNRNLKDDGINSMEDFEQLTLDKN